VDGRGRHYAGGCWLVLECGQSEPTGTNEPVARYSHQCTSWPFCSLDGLRFFIQHQMGFITIHFFSLLITLFYFF
jgi:hypothetical protein